MVKAATNDSPAIAQVHRLRAVWLCDLPRYSIDTARKINASRARVSGIYKPANIEAYQCGKAAKRSEERRVGKESSSRRRTEQGKEKKETRVVGSVGNAR